MRALPARVDCAAVFFPLEIIDMRLTRFFVVVALLFVAALLPGHASAAKVKAKTAAKCAAGERIAQGRCVKACPTEGTFGEPDSCECPSGYGKILTGNGGGQCSRLRCPTNTPMPAKKDCDCPPNYEKHNVAKGKVRCEARHAQAN